MLTWKAPGLIALGLLLVLVLAPAPPAAYACSGEPPDPRQAAAIVEGRVARVALRPDLAAPGGAFTPVEVALRVERVLHGSAPDPLTFVDPRSAVLRPDGSVSWAGGAGACGILDEDPAGRYALIVLGRRRDGEWTVHRLAGAAFDSGPDGPRVQRFRQDLMARLAPGLPNTGAGRAPGRAVLPRDVGLGLLAVAALGGARALRRRRGAGRAVAAGE